MRFLRVWAVLVTLMVAPAGLSAQPQPPKEFVPVDDVPPGEQIPAINLVATAYGLAWVMVLGYVWSIARRLQSAEAELVELESRKK